MCYKNYNYNYLDDKCYKINNIIKLSNKDLLFGIIDYQSKKDCCIIESKLINKWMILFNLIGLKYQNINLLNWIKGKTIIITFKKINKK